MSTRAQKAQFYAAVIAAEKKLLSEKYDINPELDDEQFFEKLLKPLSKKNPSSASHNEEPSDKPIFTQYGYKETADCF